MPQKESKTAIRVHARGGKETGETACRQNDKGQFTPADRSLSCIHECAGSSSGTGGHDRHDKGSADVAIQKGSSSCYDVSASRSGRGDILLLDDIEPNTCTVPRGSIRAAFNGNVTQYTAAANSADTVDWCGTAGDYFINKYDPVCIDTVIRQFFDKYHSARIRTFFSISSTEQRGSLSSRKKINEKQKKEKGFPGLIADEWVRGF